MSTRDHFITRVQRFNVGRPYLNRGLLQCTTSNIERRRAASAERNGGRRWNESATTSHCRHCRDRTCAAQRDSSGAHCNITLSWLRRRACVCIGPCTTLNCYVGGDTCELGQCCLNPCGYLFKRLGVCLQRYCSRSFHGEALCDAFLSKKAAYSYVLLCYGAWTLIFFELYPLCNENSNVPTYHRKVGYLVFFACVVSWRYASTTSPGNITKESLHSFDNYYYDNILYQDRMCPTLHIRKLPRSKYDRYTDTHVPRFDHHCLVLNQSVGEENYRLFLTFLAVHVGMCWYGAVLTCRILWSEVLQRMNTTSGKKSPKSINKISKTTAASHGIESSIQLRREK